MITAVIGNFGVGKTHWIKEKIKQHNEDGFYFSPKNNIYLEILECLDLKAILHLLSLSEIISPDKFLLLTIKYR